MTTKLGKILTFRESFLPITSLGPLITWSSKYLYYDYCFIKFFKYCISLVDLDYYTYSGVYYRLKLEIK